MEDSDTTLTARFDLMRFTENLIEDLQQLRDGKISVRDAQARALLAKHVLRAVHYVVLSRRFLGEQARLVDQTIEKDV